MRLDVCKEHFETAIENVERPSWKDFSNGFHGVDRLKCLGYAVILPIVCGALELRSIANSIVHVVILPFSLINSIHSKSSEPLKNRAIKLVDNSLDAAFVCPASFLVLEVRLVAGAFLHPGFALGFDQYRPYTAIAAPAA
jgi:hypothetical protein